MSDLYLIFFKKLSGCVFYFLRLCVCLNDINNHFLLKRELYGLLRKVIDSGLGKGTFSRTQSPCVHILCV